MKQGNLPTSKIAYWSLSLMAIIVTGIFMSSCVDKKDEQSTAMVGAAGNCFTLTKEQIQETWVSRGHTSNADPKQNISYVQIFVGQKPGANNFELSMQGYRADHTAIGDLVKLGDGQGCGQDVSNSMIGKYYINFDKLNILKDPSTVRDNLVRLQFGPAPYKIDESKFDLMQLSVTSFSSDGEPDGLDPALPCPPCINCNPRCPPNCTPACTEPLDTLKSAGSTVAPLDTMNIRKQ